MLPILQKQSSVFTKLDSSPYTPTMACKMFSNVLGMSIMTSLLLPTIETGERERESFLRFGNRKRDF
jgi:hypothetical protein